MILSSNFKKVQSSSRNKELPALAPAANDEATRRVTIDEDALIFLSAKTRSDKLSSTTQIGTTGS
jgi:adenylosuccinate synthase